jgi:hypothetical protein
MARIAIHSRPGNMTLALVGSIVSIAAVVLLALFLFQTWYGASFSERALQLMLPLCAIAGALMVRIAAENLGIGPRRLRRG